MTKALEAAGLKPSEPTFVLWLGVTPYLTPDAVFATLGELGAVLGRARGRVRLCKSLRRDPGGGDAALS